MEACRREYIEQRGGVLRGHFGAYAEAVLVVLGRLCGPEHIKYPTT